MTAEWRPDPFNRAQWRYFDGASWTHHIATGGQQSVESSELPLTPPTIQAPPPPASPVATPYPAWAATPQRKGGRLIAAGILGILSGVLGFVAAIGYFVLLDTPNCATAALGQSCTNVTVNDSSFVKALMGISIVFTIALFVAGIGGCMRRYWGQRALIVLGGVQILFDVIAMIVHFQAASLINIGFCAVLIALARANDRSEYELPKSL